MIFENARKIFAEGDGWGTDGDMFLWAHSGFSSVNQYRDFYEAIQLIKEIKLKSGVRLIYFIQEEFNKIQKNKYIIEEYFKNLNVEKRLERILQIHKNPDLSPEFPFFLVPQLRKFQSAGANKKCVFIEMSNKYTKVALQEDASIGFHEMLHVMLDIKNMPEIVEEFNNPFPNSTWQQNTVQFEELIVYSLCAIFDQKTEKDFTTEIDKFKEQGNHEMIFIYEYMPEAISILKEFLEYKKEAKETFEELREVYRRGLRELT